MMGAVPMRVTKPMTVIVPLIVRIQMPGPFDPPNPIRINFDLILHRRFLHPLAGLLVPAQPPKLVQAVR